MLWLRSKPYRCRAMGAITRFGPPTAASCSPSTKRCSPAAGKLVLNFRTCSSVGVWCSHGCAPFLISYLYIFFTWKSGIVQQGLSGSTGAILLQRHAWHCDMLCWQFASGFDRHTETWTQTSGSEGWSASLLGRMTEQFDIPLNLRVGKRNFLRFAQIVAQICPKLIHFRINSLQGVTLGLSPPPRRSVSEHHIFKPFRWVAVLGNLPQNQAITLKNG